MARSGLTLKSRRRTIRSGAPTPGGFTEPYSGPGKSMYWGCPPSKGNQPFYNAAKGDVVVPIEAFLEAMNPPKWLLPQGYVPLSEARMPGALGPVGWTDGAGNPAAPCGLMKFSTTSAQTGQWVTITTNFNVSDLRGVRFGGGAVWIENAAAYGPATTLGMAGTPQGDSNPTGEFQGISANQFRIRLKKPGKYVGSHTDMEMRLTFYEYVNGAPYLSELCVSCNIDATHVLQVSGPAGGGKHPGGMAVPSHKPGASKPSARALVSMGVGARRPSARSLKSRRRTAGAPIKAPHGGKSYAPMGISGVTIYAGHEPGGWGYTLHVFGEGLGQAHTARIANVEAQLIHVSPTKVTLHTNTKPAHGVQLLDAAQSAFFKIDGAKWVYPDRGPSGLTAPRGKPAAKRGLTFRSKVRRPGIGFHPGLLAAAAHGAAHGAAVVAPIQRKKGSARAIGDGSCGPGIG